MSWDVTDILDPHAVATELTAPALPQSAQLNLASSAPTAPISARGQAVKIMTVRVEVTYIDANRDVTEVEPEWTDIVRSAATAGAYDVLNDPEEDHWDSL